MLSAGSHGSLSYHKDLLGCVLDKRMYEEGRSLAWLVCTNTLALSE